jgi:hypothetical protein
MGEAIRFVSCKTHSARLAFFSTSTMRQYEVSLFFSVLRTTRVRGHHINCVGAGYPCVCFLSMKTIFSTSQDEVIRGFPFLFSLTDYPGEGPPYQLRSSRVSVLVFFLSMETILSTCFHQLLLYSLPGLGAALSASVASTDP